MDAVVIAALITGTCSIIAASVTFLAKEAYDHRTLASVSKRSKKALEGKWLGTVDQNMGQRGNIKYRITSKIKVSSKIIKADTTIFYDDDPKNPQVDFLVTGGFYYERFIKFDYYSSYQGSVHFGSMILELSSDAKELNGKFVGYGLKTQALVEGEVTLSKILT